MSSYEYEFRSQYIIKAWNEIPLGHNIAIFGAGLHTEWLLSTIELPKSAFIIDEFSDLNSLHGTPVYKPLNAPFFDTIFISSDTKEAKLIERCQALFPKKPFIAPYSKIGIGPFRTEPLKSATSSPELKQWKNEYSGKKCFIIGNGPSLNKMDLSQLANEYTFGANRVYLLFKKMGFETSFLTCVNPHIIEQFQNDLSEITCPKFFSGEYKRLFKNEPTNSFFLPPQDAGTPCFHKDLSQGLWWGATVTYVSMQLAFYMGFQEVYLIGVDHSFKDKGKPNKLVKFDSDDQNHFDPDYFKGYQWQLPDLETSELAYRMAKLAYSKAGRVIKDATIDGHLNVFEKVDYNSLF